MKESSGEQSIEEAVRQRYAALARTEMASACCCPPGEGAHSRCVSPGYSAAEMRSLPQNFRGASLGCGNPFALGRLQPGQTCLDLGSGAGLDVLLAAKQVGPDGYVYGLDATEEMVQLATENAEAAEVDNVEFMCGDMARIPLDDASVDVIISNCVVNLAPEKTDVFAELFRVLRPGGEIAISDLLWESERPVGATTDPDLWCSCVGGALTEREWYRGLEAAGFQETSIRIEGAWADDGLPEGARIVSALVFARKPVPTG